MERAGNEEDCTENDLLPSFGRITICHHFIEANIEESSAHDQENKRDQDGLPGDLNLEVVIRRHVPVQPSAVLLHCIPGQGSLKRCFRLNFFASFSFLSRVYVRCFFTFLFLISCKVKLV